MKTKIIHTDMAPSPKGPYSQGVIAGDFVFIAGQGPVDPRTGELLLGDVRAECELTLKNIEAILTASGATLQDVVKCTVYLRDLADFSAMNEVYQRFFPRNCPARSTIQAGNLFGGIKIEIDAVAAKSRHGKAIGRRRERRSPPGR